MFSNEDFLKASRDFVCIRIETFENKESEAMVRELLNGRLANTSFMIFDPQGQRKMVRAGRSPSAAVGGRGPRKAQQAQPDPNENLDDGAVIETMQKIAARFTPAENNSPALLQDFKSFRTALNVASADQRLLVTVYAEDKDRQQVKDNLEQVFSDSDILGKFHLNFLDPKVDELWSKSIKGETSSPGIFIIRPGTFGLDGLVMQKLPPTAGAEEIKSAMVARNEEYSFVEARKKYSQHVIAGKRKGIKFENEIPSEGTSDNPKQSDSPRRRRK